MNESELEEKVVLARKREFFINIMYRDARIMVSDLLYLCMAPFCHNEGTQLVWFENSSSPVILCVHCWKDFYDGIRFNSDICQVERKILE